LFERFVLRAIGRPILDSHDHDWPDIFLRTLITIRIGAV
jgi:hypothetical protein